MLESILLCLITPCLFIAFRALQSHYQWLIFNPILLSIVVISVTLYQLDIEYQKYNQSSVLFNTLLEFAIVALALPLYNEFNQIRNQLLKVVICATVGVIVSSTTAMAIAFYLGASDVIISSVAPNAVTTPIAISVSSLLNGIPALSAIIVICVGIIGATFALPLLILVNGDKPIENGLAIGSACHAIGTAKANEHNPEMGAYASVSLILSAILTPLLLPIIHTLFQAISNA